MSLDKVTNEALKTLQVANECVAANGADGERLRDVNCKLRNLLAEVAAARSDAESVGPFDEDKESQALLDAIGKFRLARSRAEWAFDLVRDGLDELCPSLDRPKLYRVHNGDKPHKKETERFERRLEWVEHLIRAARQRLTEYATAALELQGVHEAAFMFSGPLARFLKSRLDAFERLAGDKERMADEETFDPNKWAAQIMANAEED